MSYVEEIVSLADDGLARIERIRRDLETLRHHDGDPTWIEPVDAVLAVVGEMVEGARDLAAEGDTTGLSPELLEAVEELKQAVSGVATLLTGEREAE